MIVEALLLCGCGLLRRYALYPIELRGLIQKLFHFEGFQDSNNSIFRRYVLYPSGLRRHCDFLMVKDGANRLSGLWWSDYQRGHRIIRFLFELWRSFWTSHSCESRGLKSVFSTLPHNSVSSLLCGGYGLKSDWAFNRSCLSHVTLHVKRIGWEPTNCSTKYAYQNVPFHTRGMSRKQYNILKR